MSENTRVTRSSARKTGAQTANVLNKPNSRRQPAKVIESDSDDEEETIFNNSSKSQTTPTKKRASFNQSEVGSVTPPKQARNQNAAYNSEVLNTPSGMLKKLAIFSPEKKKYGPSSKKSLHFPHNNETCDLEQENKLKSTSKSSKKGIKLNDSVVVDDLKVAKTDEHASSIKPKSQYQNARKALHSNAPTEMPGREKEIEELTNFIEENLGNDSSASIYVSGPPGTGKTASLNLILQREDILSQVQYIYINCTAIKSATSVYSRLTKQLNLKVSGKSEKDHLSGIEKYLKRKHKMILIVLDEIDQLETKNLSILYTIFEWPSTPSSRIILVGIANALDLTDRTLPRLQARCELKPKLLHFAPYSKEQIVKIFTSRLESAGVLDVFSPIALQMLAGKVSSVSGDVRRALDIGRRVVELVDRHKQGDILKSVENFAKELDNESKSVEPVKKVNIQEVVSVLNNVYGTSQNLGDDVEETFPLQQKIVICSLLLMIKKTKNKDITVGKLHETYCRVCTKKNLTPVDQAEFVGLCSLIETRGIIKVSGKKEPRMHKVNLEWNEGEVAEALRDKQLLSTILQDESCLGK